MKREKVIIVKVTQEEHRHINDVAYNNRTTVSDLIRKFIQSDMPVKQYTEDEKKYIQDKFEERLKDISTYTEYKFLCICRGNTHDHDCIFDQWRVKNPRIVKFIESK